MSKCLFIFPGGGDPECFDYKAGFDLIEEQAKLRGYTVIKIFKYPGHFSYTGQNEFLNLKTAKETVLPYILEAETKGIEYDFYARSYGCGVVMDILLNNTLNFLNKVTLWGPVPIVHMYEVCIHDASAVSYARERKGCWLNDDSFHSVEPFEIQLMKYNGKQILQLGTGELDIHCKPIFFEFLVSYIPDNSKFRVMTIKGLKHEVISFNADYINLIFEKS